MHLQWRDVRRKWKIHHIFCKARWYVSRELLLLFLSSLYDAQELTLIWSSSRVPRLSYQNFEHLREELFITFQRIKVPKIKVRCKHYYRFVFIDHVIKSPTNTLISCSFTWEKNPIRIDSLLFVIHKSWGPKILYRRIPPLTNNSSSLGKRG